MWRVIIQCSAESWQAHAVELKAIVARYPVTLLASKKMQGDDRRIMDYQLDDVNQAEELIAECMTLNGFTGSFEAL